MRALTMGDCARPPCAIVRSYRGLLPGFGRRLRRLRLAFYGATGGHFAGVTGMASMQRGMQRLFVDARSFEVNTPLPAVVERHQSI